MLQVINGDGRCLEPHLSQPQFGAAFAMLKVAAEYAEQTSGQRWEFAVEIDRLRGVGLSLNDLRWLVRMQYVQHAREVTLEEEDGRRFHRSGDLTFSSATCFVATDRFLARADAADPDWPRQVIESTTIAAKAVCRAPRPRWDADVRELWMGQTLVKRFKWQACNQEMILAAFQEDDWPAVIDDPLPPQPQQNPKRRLHDTIKSLNRHQCTQMMRFHGNGTGEGVRWKVLAP